MSSSTRTRSPSLTTSRNSTVSSATRSKSSAAAAFWISLASASDALRHYPEGRDRGRGLAFFLERFRERAHFPGVEMGPAVIKTVLDLAPDDALREGWEAFREDGPHPLLPELYEALIGAARRTAEVLGPEDIFHLERRTALKKPG